ncbi:hypothetical protein Pla52o_16900 [Novipirellula galeiformis]|uniref:Uncharacterized protein n=1 Tax=Novipirellula galeiformis TaxID=2528004 RepID=A0A5C6CRB1_9BACT|nr:hypothetical protein Pla52o_16900 [Novipirellula galeiformis]
MPVLPATVVPACPPVVAQRLEPAPVPKVLLPVIAAAFPGEVKCVNPEEAFPAATPAPTPANTPETVPPTAPAIAPPLAALPGLKPVLPEMPMPTPAEIPPPIAPEIAPAAAPPPAPAKAPAGPPTTNPTTAPVIAPEIAPVTAPAPAPTRMFPTPPQKLSPYGSTVSNTKYASYSDVPSTYPIGSLEQDSNRRQLS